MPNLEINHYVRQLKKHSLYKKITSLGSGEDNDIVCTGPGVRESHCLIYFSNNGFEIEAVNKKCLISINGKSIKKRSSLLPSDILMIGELEAKLSLQDEAHIVRQPKAQETTDIAVFRKLRDLSTYLSKPYTSTELLEKIMDDVISLTDADKGFILLLTEESLNIKVARNLNRETLFDAEGQISDSIVNKVLERRTPLIVSDALNDQEFNVSMSVINLKLCSVMCVPLMDRGELLGIIYVGNNNVVNLFQSHHLELLSIFSSQIALILANAILIDDLMIKNKKLTKELENIKFGSIIGNSFVMREIYRKIEKIAPTDVTVLVEGETGTGKELIAEELHRHSQRCNGPFVVINCGAIPENLLESELFGHVKGAFTGAVQNKAGKFQQADKGTLFLDEIGEMPLSLQVKLLRAVQERKVMRVGSAKVEEVDIRIVAATNRNLEQEVKENRFREDLYYRLNVVKLMLPPLRERGDDVIVIAKTLLERYSKDFNVANKVLSREACQAIKKYSWPGNIRQLQNRLKKAVIMSDGPMISPDDLDLLPEAVSVIKTLAEAKMEFQQRYIDEILELNNGNRSKTARDLDVAPRTIFRHLEKHGDDQ